ncbi:MAG TPA: tetratricopeptide repeat protein [Candidatus Aquilonibacter sp.]|nr:tetratricopeptide repeat protein [Candidatus Aquilonibacter sp.]
MKSLTGLSLFVLLALAPATAAAAPQDLLAAGRVDQAIQSLQQEINGSPNAEAYNLLCRSYFTLEQWDRGIAACLKAVDLAPDNSRYHLWLGRIYGEKADHVNFLSAASLAGKVRTEFERAVALNPENYEARTDLAEFYLEAPGIVGGGQDKARAQADLIAPKNPAVADWIRGRIAEKNKDESTAEREYRAAIAASRGGARAWLNLALFYRQTRHYDQMEQALSRLESAPLDHPAALMDGASILLHADRNFPLAARLLQRYLASSTTVEEAPVFKAHYLLGELLEKQGDRQAAAEEYRASLSLAHDFGSAREGLRRVER